MKNLFKKIGLSFELARWRYAPVGLLPILLGFAIAWHNYNNIVWWKFFVCLGGMFFAHLGANAANDYFDYLSGVDKFAYDKIPEMRGSGVCSSGVLTTGRLSIKEALAAVIIFFSLALAAGTVLTITCGWTILLLAVLGFFLGMFYCAPPVAFGYLGYALGEVGIFLAFGPLPVLGSYYVATGTSSWGVVIASLPLAFLTTSVVFNQHFAHADADRAGGKLTPVVTWGETRMRFVSRWMLVAAYVAIIVGVIVGTFPVYSLVALGVAPIILMPAFRIPVPATPSASLSFLFKVVRANILTATVLVISFVLPL